MNFAIIFIILLVLGTITLGASTYGLGQHEDNRQSNLYKTSTAFSIIGAVFILLGLGGLSWKALKECPRFPIGDVAARGGPGYGQAPGSGSAYGPLPGSAYGSFSR